MEQQDQGGPPAADTRHQLAAPGQRLQLLRPLDVTDFMMSGGAATAFAAGGEQGYIDYIARHGGLSHVLSNEAAQAAFARGGEAGHLRYVDKTLNDLRLGGFKLGVEPDRAQAARGASYAEPLRPFVVTRKPAHGQPPISQSRALVAAKPDAIDTDQAPDTSHPAVPYQADGGAADEKTEANDASQPPAVPLPAEPAQAEPDDVPSDAATDAVRLPFVDPDELHRAELAFNQAGRAYAEIIARQRASHIGALLLSAGWLADVRRRLYRRTVTRAQGEQTQAAQAREAYRRQLDEYVQLLSPDAVRQAEARLDTMPDFETWVLEFQAQRAQPGGNGNHNDAPANRADRVRARLTQAWLARGRSRKGLMVAVPSAVLGVGAGVVTGAVAGVPILVTVGVGIATVAAGGFIGDRIAKVVNRYKAASERGYIQLRNRAQERAAAMRGEFAAQNYQRVRQNNEQPDITTAYEAGTLREMQENARRIRLARAAGAIAAAGGFAAGNLVASGIRGLASQHLNAARKPPQATPAHTPTKTPTSTTQPNAPPAPANLTHEFPWDAATQYNAAHHLSTNPNSVWDTLHRMAQAFNQAHPGAHYAYVMHPNGTIWLQNGSHALSPAQNAAFNQFLWNIR